MGKQAVIFAIILLTATVVCATVVGQQRPPPPAPPFRVIVHPGNPVSSVERKFLEDAFLKKVTVWPSGEVIKPVDLPPDSPVRRRFSHDILNRSVEAVKGYWQQRIFSGRDVPPPELDGDDEVVKYVLKHEGGVGYVSGTAETGDCKTLIVR
jgi:ABC-type phosphate transport system substrate-binding protein